jgi:hypothetical protein
VTTQLRRTLQALRFSTVKTVKTVKTALSVSVRTPAAQTSAPSVRILATNWSSI